MFSEHGIPEVLHSDNGLQYVSAQFTDFCTSWGITHETLSPHYLQSNRFAEACVKLVKHALQHAKYSSAGPQLSPWHSELHQLMPISHRLLSFCTNARLGPPFLPKSTTLTLQPSQVREWINTHSDASKAQEDKHCRPLAPLYAGQPVAMYDTICKIWIPATVVHVLSKDSYQACSSNGMAYCCTR